MSFEPVWGPGVCLLILGTWPSPKSRQQGFYYGHPQNRFWPLLAALCGAPEPKDVPAKKRLILEHGLALWDTLASRTITGASDASIRDIVPNDIASLCTQAPIQAVVCNGAAAYRVYSRYVQPLAGLPAVRLPSTSPANAHASMQYLREEWGRALAPWLPERTDAHK